jgi:hypothetical protein
MAWFSGSWHGLQFHGIQSGSWHGFKLIRTSIETLRYSIQERLSVNQNLHAMTAPHQISLASQKTMRNQVEKYLGPCVMSD